MEKLINRRLLSKILLIIGVLSATLWLCFFGDNLFSIPNRIDIIWVGLSVLILWGGLSLLLFDNIRLHIDILERYIRSLHSQISLSTIKNNRPIYFLRHAVAPDFIELISEIIRRRPITRVLELGCGTSSVYIASILPPAGNGGHLVCLEQNPAWGKLIRSEISAHANLAKAEVLFAPLVPIPEYSLPFYDVKALRSFSEPFDMLVIDGPADVRMRRAAFPFLKKFLSDSAVVVLDDGDHQHVKETINKWLENNGDWKANYYKTVKGTWVLWNSLYPFELGLP